MNVDADHPKPPPVPVGVNERNLADRCSGGDLGAGIALVELLSRKGVDVTLDALVSVVSPTGRLTPLAFDTLVDAWRRWALAKYARDNHVELPD